MGRAVCRVLGVFALAAVRLHVPEARAQLPGETRAPSPAGTGEALAPPADLGSETLAKGLFDTARALLDRGDYARACPMFAESHRLDPGGGTVLNLALCREREGRLADAWAAYQEALQRAISDGRADRERIARSHMAVLEPRLTVLVVGLPAGVGEVDIDGRRLAPTQLGAGVWVDAGAHRVDWSPLARPPRVWRGGLAEGEVKELHEADFLPLGEGAAPSRAAPSSGASPLPLSPLAPRSATSWSVGSKVAFAGAAASLVASGVMAVVAMNQESAFEASCIPERNFCPGGVAGHDAARTWAIASTSALGSAVVLAVLGLLLPRVEAPAARLPHAEHRVGIPF